MNQNSSGNQEERCKKINTHFKNNRFVCHSKVKSNCGKFDIWWPKTYQERLQLKTEVMLYISDRVYITYKKITLMYM